MDKPTGLLKFDRILYTSTHDPANYGDPPDVLVLCSETLKS